MNSAHPCLHDTAVLTGSKHVLAHKKLLTQIREVRHRFLGQDITANGNQAKFADTYNYIVEGYSVTVLNDHAIL